jgi:ubiquitin-like 1-activating enzyme E1 B
MLFEDPKSGESSVYMQYFPPKLDPQVSGGLSPEVHYACDMVKAMFITEIYKRIDMNTYKTAKSTPNPLDPALVDSLSSDVQKAFGASSSPLKNVAGWDRQVFSVSEAVVELMLYISFYLKNQLSSLGSIAFDKDDDLAMRFVSAAANLRCRIFNIPPQSYYDAKGIAGNIIPAIATTNAIVAGIQVMYAINLLKPGVSVEDRVKTCKHTYCLRAATRRGLYIQPTSPEEPKSECFVCQTSQVTVQLDTSKTTLGDLLVKVLKGKLGFNEPTIIHQQVLMAYAGITFRYFGMF